MIKNIKKISFLVAFLFSTNVFSESLKDIYNEALTNNNKIQSVEIQYEATKELVEQAKSQFLPQITANYSIKKENYELPDNNKVFNETTKNKNIQLNQNIYNRSLNYQLDSSLEKTQYSFLNIVNEKNKLGFEIIESYFLLQMLEKNRLISKERIDSTNKKIDIVNEQFKYGLSTKLEQLNLIAELNEVNSQLLEEEQMIVFYKKKLSSFINRDNLNIEVKDYNIEHLYKNIFLKRPIENDNYEVQLKERNLAVEQNELEVRKSAYYPTISAGASYSDAEGSTFFAQKRKDKMVYLEIKVPIFSGGYDSSRVREIEKNIQANQKDLEYTKQTISFQKQEKNSNIRSAIEQYYANKKTIESQEEFLKSIEEAYNLGLKNLSDVTISKDKLYHSKKERNRIVKDFMINLFAYYSMTTTLNEVVNEIN